MRKAIYFAIVSLVLMSCDKEEPQLELNTVQPTKLTIWMHPYFEGEDLVAGQTYLNVSNYRVNVTDLKMYLSHIYGINTSGDTIYFSDIAFLDILSGNNCVVINDPIIGSFSSFGFGLGVAEEMNSPSNPDFNISIYDANHPLSLFNNMYWTWAAGYRFVIFDGKYDVDANSTEPLIDGFSFHTGKDESYRTKVWNNISFEIAPNQQTDIHIDMAVDRFYYSSTDTVDIAIDNQSHGTNQTLSDRISDNIIQSMSYRQ
jgi:hypothetical protein